MRCLRVLIVPFLYLSRNSPLGLRQMPELGIGFVIFAVCSVPPALLTETAKEFRRFLSPVSKGKFKTDSSSKAVVI